MLALVWLFASACGATDQDWETTDELGELEQEFRGKETPNFQYGTRTGITKQRCDKTTAGQVCAIPPSKTLTYCINLGPITGGSAATAFTGSEHARIAAIIEGFDGGSDFALNILGVDECMFATDMSISKAAVGTSGTASNEIKDYATTTMTGMTGLTEGAGVVGSYQTWTQCNWNIDMVDILAKGTSSTQDNNGLDHAAKNSLLGCLGVGRRSTNPGGLGSRNLVNMAIAQTGVSAGEACSLTGFTLSDPGQYNLNPDCPSD
jgi:hypothetical protein